MFVAINMSFPRLTAIVAGCDLDLPVATLASVSHKQLELAIWHFDNLAFSKLVTLR